MKVGEDWVCLHTFNAVIVLEGNKVIMDKDERVARDLIYVGDKLTITNMIHDNMQTWVWFHNYTRAISFRANSYKFLQNCSKVYNESR